MWNGNNGVIGRRLQGQQLRQRVARPDLAAHRHRAVGQLRLRRALVADRLRQGRRRRRPGRHPGRHRRRCSPCPDGRARRRLAARDRPGRRLRHVRRPRAAGAADRAQGGARPERRRAPRARPDAQAGVLLRRRRHGELRAAEGGHGRHRASSARGLGRPAAGKTGTTNDNKSALFAGYTPQLAAAVMLVKDGKNGQPGVDVRRRRPAHGDRRVVPGADLDGVHEGRAEGPAGAAVRRRRRTLPTASPTPTVSASSTRRRRPTATSPVGRSPTPRRRPHRADPAGAEPPRRRPPAPPTVVTAAERDGHRHGHRRPCHRGIAVAAPATTGERSARIRGRVRQHGTPCPSPMPSSCRPTPTPWSRRDRADRRPVRLPSRSVRRVLDPAALARPARDARLHASATSPSCRATRRRSPATPATPGCATPTSRSSTSCAASPTAGCPTCRPDRARGRRSSTPCSPGSSCRSRPGSPAGTAARRHRALRVLRLERRPALRLLRRHGRAHRAHRAPSSVGRRARRARARRHPLRRHQLGPVRRRAHRRLDARLVALAARAGPACCSGWPSRRSSTPCCCSVRCSCSACGPGGCARSGSRPAGPRRRGRW